MIAKNQSACHLYRYLEHIHTCIPHSSSAVGCPLKPEPSKEQFLLKQDRQPRLLSFSIIPREYPHDRVVAKGFRFGGSGRAGGKVGTTGAILGRRLRVPSLSPSEVDETVTFSTRCLTVLIQRFITVTYRENRTERGLGFLNRPRPANKPDAPSKRAQASHDT